jgi:hypothetical protein
VRQQLTHDLEPFPLEEALHALADHRSIVSRENAT